MPTPLPNPPPLEQKTHPRCHILKTVANSTETMSSNIEITITHPIQIPMAIRTQLLEPKTTAETYPMVLNLLKTSSK